MNLQESATNRPSHVGFLVLRTPLLPFDDFLRWSSLIGTSDETVSGDSYSETSWRHQVQALRRGLREVVAQPEVQRIRQTNPGGLV